jgi:hypothetical protein
MLLSGSIALLFAVLLAGYGAWWATGGGGTVEEIVVTATRPSPPPGVAAEPAEVAAARIVAGETAPSGSDDERGDEDESLGWSVTVVPSLLLRVEPTLDALARRQLPVETPVEILDGSAVADGYDWVHVRIEDGTEGWLIADGVA